MSTWVDVEDDLVDEVDDLARQLDCTREDAIRVAVDMALCWPLAASLVLERRRSNG
jgi:predicted transcriptional regulator